MKDNYDLKKKQNDISIIPLDQGYKSKDRYTANIKSMGYNQYLA